MLQLIPLTNPLLLKAYTAAFSEKSLSVQDVHKFDISSAVEVFLQCEDTLAPRYFANLLLGSVRIFGHQVEQLFTSVQWELQRKIKSKEVFPRLKEGQTTSTVLNATNMIVVQDKISLTEAVRSSIEPVSIEVPRVQAREQDISFEEWRDTSGRPSIRSRSSDRIPPSDSFLQDLAVDQGGLIEVDVNEPLLDDQVPNLEPLNQFPQQEKENVETKVAKPRRIGNITWRSDAATVLSKATLKEGLKNTEDILRIQTFATEKGVKIQLDGPSRLLPEALRGLWKAETFEKLIQEQQANDLPGLTPNLPINGSPNLPLEDVPDNHPDAILPEDEPIPSPTRSRLDSIASEPPQETQVSASELSHRTQKMLTLLQDRFRASSKVSFNSLTKDKSPDVKASALYELLQLTQQGFVTMGQEESFGDIVVQQGNL